MLCQSCDFTCVVVAVRHRFIDEHRLPRRQDGPHLRQMVAAIQAFLQNRINHGAKRRNIVDDFDLPLVPQVCGESIDTIPAVIDVPAATFICGDDAKARDVLRIGWIIENLGEFDTVRGVQADHPQAHRLAGTRLSKARQGAEEGQGKHTYDDVN